ncbi:hypothetical protein [Pediococcus acidilactici]|uniref:hypothetical protein n=1 Tax=Pediococcus acidilactici TaxID=1254 RepID=UPI0038579C7A
MILIYRNSYGSVLLKHLISFILLSYSFFVAFVRNLFPSANFNTAIIDKYLAILSILFIVALILATSFLIKNNGLNIRLGFYIFSALMLSAPFVAITPYGPRCAFNTVCFMILATLDVISTISIGFALTQLLHSFGIFSMIFILTIMGANSYINHSRTISARSQIQSHNTVIYVRKLPFQQYLWDSSPAIHRFQYRMYKRIMHISKKQRLVFIPYKDQH